MIVGAAIIPTAPLLVPGVTGNSPGGAARLADAIDAVIESLPPRDSTVLIAPAPGGAGHGLYDAEKADLSGIGRADITSDFTVDQQVLEHISRSTRYQRYRAAPLPLELATLVLMLGDRGPHVPMTVPPTATFEALAAVGAAIAAALEDDRRVVLVAAGDLAAGLDETAPLHVIDGAGAWNEQAAAVVDSGRLDGLRRLGPQEAIDVGALGWAPMTVLHGACARAKIGLIVRCYEAVRGVGYLVAHGG